MAPAETEAHRAPELHGPVRDGARRHAGVLGVPFRERLALVEGGQNDLSRGRGRPPAFELGGLLHGVLAVALGVGSRGGVLGGHRLDVEGGAKGVGVLLAQRAGAEVARRGEAVEMPVKAAFDGAQLLVGEARVLDLPDSALGRDLAAQGCDEARHAREHGGKKPRRERDSDDGHDGSGAVHRERAQREGGEDATPRGCGGMRAGSPSFHVLLCHGATSSSRRRPRGRPRWSRRGPRKARCPRRA